MRLAILEYNMGMFGFGILAGMIITMILMCVWGVFRKDDGDYIYIYPDDIDSYEIIS